MKLSVARKILERHMISGSLEPGRELVIRIDQTLTQDATGTMAYLELEAMGVEKLATELSVSYVDHNTVQDGFENADDHRFLQTVAARYGIVFSRAGNGICHQVHLERFARPGKTLLGSDSHTPTAGGTGAIGIGAGGLDVAVAMAKGTFSLVAPRMIRVQLTGELPPWVSAKDVILELLRRLTTKGNVGWVVEYAGPGVGTLSVPERATITNMGAELGVTTSIFPSDGVTRRFLAAQQREDQWAELAPDPNADYDKALEVDLSSLEPLIAAPHSPDNVRTVKDLEGRPVDQVCIGSCTNSSYADLMTVAKMLEGKTVHPDVSLVVAPGSRQVLQMIAETGGLAALIEAGARIGECACGFCIGCCQAPRTGATSLRTSNRNFLGRSGTKSANVYLVSPQTAAAAAATGVITDPRSLGEPPNIKVPERFIVDDSMMVRPHADTILRSLPAGAGRSPATAGELRSTSRSVVEVYRGPNIGEPPISEPAEERLSGVVAIKLGDKITTDHIMPAGARMKYRSNIPKYSEFVFESVDPTFARRAAETRERGLDNVIVAGWGYGQGSSREHAAICPMYLGVRLVAAKSIERIHRSNLINFGIVPAVFVDESDYEKLSSDDHVEVPDLRGALSSGEEIVMVNVVGGNEITLLCELTAVEAGVLLAGGMLNYVRAGNESRSTC